MRIIVLEVPGTVGGVSVAIWIIVVLLVIIALVAFFIWRYFKRPHHCMQTQAATKIPEDQVQFTVNGSDNNVVQESQEQNRTQLPTDENTICENNSIYRRPRDDYDPPVQIGHKLPFVTVPQLNKSVCAAWSISFENSTGTLLPVLAVTTTTTTSPDSGVTSGAHCHKYNIQPPEDSDRQNFVSIGECSSWMEASLRMRKFSSPNPAARTWMGDIPLKLKEHVAVSILAGQWIIVYGKRGCHNKRTSDPARHKASSYSSIIVLEVEIERRVRATQRSPQIEHRKLKMGLTVQPLHKFLKLKRSTGNHTVRGKFQSIRQLDVVARPHTT
ncbi:hypothetical protein CBL_07987 [Carabus blaptoides fortunei]